MNCKFQNVFITWSTQERRNKKKKKISAAAAKKIYISSAKF